MRADQRSDIGASNQTGKGEIMADRMISVGVNGYGVIGKRVADALRLQPDMRLVGIGDVMSDYRIKTALTRNIPVYASVAGDRKSVV